MNKVGTLSPAPVTEATTTTIDNNTGASTAAPNATNFDKCFEVDGTVIPGPTPTPIAVPIAPAAPNFENCFERAGTVVPQAQATAWIVVYGIYFVEKEKNMFMVLLEIIDGACQYHYNNDNINLTT